MNFKNRILVIQLFIVFVLANLLSGCLGPAKVNKWVAKEYGPLPAPPKNKTDYITVTSRETAQDERISTTESKTSKLLPLLFYWQFDYKNTCTLNPRIPVDNFTSTVLSYAGKRIKQKLNGQHVELTIEKMPHVFSIDDKGHLIWVIYAFGWDVLTIVPEDREMVVSYRVLKDDSTEIKKGVISIPNSDKGVALKMFQSTKKRTWAYLDDYNGNITVMTKRFSDKLITEL